MTTGTSADLLRQLAADAEWIYSQVLAPVPLLIAGRSLCACQGAARPCDSCHAGYHEDCHRILTNHECYLYRGNDGHPLARVWLADRQCHRPCACASCFPSETQLDLFGAEPR
jgi:hypothetical protein